MIKPGTYYVGDLCYVFEDADWQQICDFTCGGDFRLDGELTLRGDRTLAIYSTKNGDGSYYDTAGREYSVDSGTLGCVQLSDLTEFGRSRAGDGHVIEFSKPFRTGELDGRIYFGAIIIDTNQEDEERDRELEYEEGLEYEDA